MTASVNVEDVLAPEEMAIKDYAENQGILEHLMSLNIVSAPLRYVAAGWVQIPIVRYIGLNKDTDIVGDNAVTVRLEPF